MVEKSKVCIKCLKDKPLNLFTADKGVKGGYRGICKLCRNAYVRLNYANNTNNVRTKGLVRGLVLRSTKFYRDTQRKFRLNQNPANHKRAREKYVLKNKKKIKAKRAVQDAVTSGKLIKTGCEVCKTHIDIHGHHDDYNKLLKVRWLCRKHHTEWHRLNGEGLNGN